VSLHKSQEQLEAQPPARSEEAYQRTLHRRGFNLTQNFYRQAECQGGANIYRLFVSVCNT
jgi:hypothetical protein